MKAGRLDNVAPGEPGVNEQDLKSFLDAGAIGETPPTPHSSGSV
jgi:hypothetical protein